MFRVFTSILLVPQVHRVPQVCTSFTGFTTQLRNPSLGNPIFYFGHTQTCLTFAPAVIFIITGSKQTCFLPWREMAYLNLPSGLLYKYISLKRRSGTKAISTSAHKRYRNVRGPWRILSQQTQLLSPPGELAREITSPLGFPVVRAEAVDLTLNDR